MRKLIVLSFLSLDGVMQAPGGPEEDSTRGFKHEGWVVGYFDDFLLKVMVKQTSKAFDLLLGRKTARGKNSSMPSEVKFVRRKAVRRRPAPPASTARP